MELTSKREGGVLTVALTGELDHHNARMIREQIDALLRDTSILTLLMDMRGVTFMDSSGLGVVLGRYRLMTERMGCMRIAGANREAERIMKMAGVYALIQREKQGESHYV